MNPGMYRAGSPFCQPPGRTACDARAAIDRYLPYSDRIGVCVAQDSEQSSIPQVESDLANPLSVGGLEHDRWGTSCERY